MTIAPEAEHHAGHDFSCECWRRREGCGCFLWDEDCPSFAPVDPHSVVL